MSENITNVKLLYVPLDNEYKHTLYFSMKSNQESYFNNITEAKSFSDFSYQPKDSKLRVNLSLDEAMKYNYVMYKNTHYKDKYFYAFIVDYEWKNDNLTELTLETDVLQTWFFDYSIRPSFIEREHTNYDGIGFNTYPENLEVGEYITEGFTKIPVFEDLNIVMGTTSGTDGKAYSGIRYTGIYSGIRYDSFPISETGLTNLNTVIDKYAEAGRSDSIVSLFIAPASLSVRLNAETSSAVLPTASPFSTTYAFNVPDGFSDYTPKNKKLLSYPYRYLLVSNNNGGSAIYHYEHFSNIANSTQINFMIKGVLCPGCSIRINPLQYKKAGENVEEGLNLGKFPICNWTSDEYTNWLTQNSVNIGLNLASGVGQIVAGGAIAVASGGLGMAVGGSQMLGGLGAITSQLAQIHQMSFTPPQAHGNINAGDVICSTGNNTFTFYKMRCKSEYLKIIDDYFSMFGYKINRVKIPYKNHRKQWWYTKTIDVNITGQIPIGDINKIKACYNNGITFWKNPENIKNYSLDNDIDNDIV